MIFLIWNAWQKYLKALEGSAARKNIEKNLLTFWISLLVECSKEKHGFCCHYTSNTFETPFNEKKIKNYSFINYKGCSGELYGEAQMFS